MKEFSFKKIDAFATEQSDGNPAGYIALNSLTDISEHEMLRIAKEMKGYVNEVGYVAQVGARDFDLRYYSSEKEVDFCGHATIAIMYDIIRSSKDLADTPTLTINTNKGTLTVFNRIVSENAVFIMSPVPVFKDLLPDTSEIQRVLGLTNEGLDKQFPVSIINAGLTTLIVPVKSLNAILSIKPQMEVLKMFCLKNGIEIIEVFTSDVSNKSNKYRTRVFAPIFGYIEDPATGSGNSALGYYLIENNLWSEEYISIEQNGLRDNFNVVKLQKQTDEDYRQRVCFGGVAVTRIEGKYLIH
ncbi:MAG TPA: PhzF family phenazine biosynthesis isomerase [Bacteroidales bacterium]|nr:PhzF family phenazine biosynthesis isomerase [Bacteroidales bacterium]